MSVEWAPFLLQPNTPEEGVEKPGGPGLHNVGDRIRQSGQAAGINFTGLCGRSPNTVKAHALMTHALETGGAAKQNQLQEVLFRQYFTDGKYPDIANLVAAAEEVGLSGSEARSVLEDGRYEARVKGEAAQASSSGISGVPYFFFNGKPAFSGAQPPASFLEVLRNA